MGMLFVVFFVCFFVCFESGPNTQNGKRKRQSDGYANDDESSGQAQTRDLRRGRHRGLFVLKSRGELTLVGPFRTGKTEGPCRSFPGEANAEIESALVDFVSSFLEEAASP